MSSKKGQKSRKNSSANVLVNLNLPYGGLWRLIIGTPQVCVAFGSSVCFAMLLSDLDNIFFPLKLTVLIYSHLRVGVEVGSSRLMRLPRRINIPDDGERNRRRLLFSLSFAYLALVSALEEATIVSNKPIGHKHTHNREYLN